jgi:hypothetical protein
VLVPSFLFFGGGCVFEVFPIASSSSNVEFMLA